MHRTDYPKSSTSDGYQAHVHTEEAEDHSGVKYSLDLFLTGYDKQEEKIHQVESLSRTLSSTEIAHCLRTCTGAMEEASQSIRQILLERAESMAKWSIYDHARRILDIHLPTDTTELSWVDDEGSKNEYAVCQHISNMVYKANVRLEEMTPWRGETPYWLVSYNLCPNCSFPGGRTSICGITDKKFKDQQKAYAYLNGRKAWLEKHFFQEMKPVIPRAYETFFLYFGAKLPIYTYESDSTS